MISASAENYTLNSQQEPTHYFWDFAHLSDIIPSANVCIYRVMGAGRADESLHDWWETMQSVVLYHSSLWAAASLYDIPQPLYTFCNFDILLIS